MTRPLQTNRDDSHRDDIDRDQCWAGRTAGSVDEVQVAIERNHRQVEGPGVRATELGDQNLRPRTTRTVAKSSQRSQSCESFPHQGLQKAYERVTRQM